MQWEDKKLLNLCTYTTDFKHKVKFNRKGKLEKFKVFNISVWIIDSSHRWKLKEKIYE